MVCKAHLPASGPSHRQQLQFLSVQTLSATTLRLFTTADHEPSATMALNLAQAATMTII